MLKACKASELEFDPGDWFFCSESVLALAQSVHTKALSCHMSVIGHSGLCVVHTSAFFSNLSLLV